MEAETLIFKNKQKGKKPSFKRLLAIFKKIVENFGAETASRLKSFRGFWAPVWNALNQGSSQCFGTHIINMTCYRRYAISK